jgi:erythromycin esterase-like protein
VVWAHNQHVFTIRLAEAPGQPMGLYLRQALGHRYAVVGFDFAFGGFTARTASATPAQVPAPAPVEAQTIQAAPPDSFAATFQQLEPEAFILGLALPRSGCSYRLALHSPFDLVDWCGVQPSHGDGFTIALPLTDGFDAIVFIRNAPSNVVPEA